MKTRRAKRVVEPPPVIRAFKRRFRWEGVEVEPYKIRADRPAEFRGASRQVLVGQQGEQVGFHLRYFELEPGGHTTLERHHHAHVVIGARGRGVARVGQADYLINPMDTLYIAPGEPHQLAATQRTRFGFFCIVNARRDKP